MSLCRALRRVRSEKNAMLTGVVDVLGKPIKKGDLVFCLTDKSLRHINYNGLEQQYEAVRTLPRHQPNKEEKFVITKPGFRWFKINHS